MKTYKHNFLALILLFSTVLFAQKQDKKVSESFNVNSDVVVDITARYTDVVIETWNKNVVSVEGVWQTDGLNKEESNELFESVDFEALGNKEKVVITAKSNQHNLVFVNALEDIDFNFDLESIANIGEVVTRDFHLDLSEYPEIPDMPKIPEVALEMPETPEIVLSHLSKIEFDYDAYEKDKEGYMKVFKENQKAWEKEFEEKIAPQMEEYEKKMEEWEKENEPKIKKMQENMAKYNKETKPQMKEFGLRMAAWEKENAHKIKAFEEKMEKIGKKMEEKYSALLELKHKNGEGTARIKKSLLIKIPKNAKVKLDVRYGVTYLPNNMNTVY